MNVLFVEDDAMNRRVVKDMLRVVGADMDEAPDAGTGLRMMDERRFNVVLMDIRMPSMDGLTAIRHLRQKATATRDVPVIVVTADAGADLSDRCFAAGANDVIQKPVAIGALLQAVGRITAQRDGDVLLDADVEPIVLRASTGSYGLCARGQ